MTRVSTCTQGVILLKGKKMMLSNVFTPNALNFISPKSFSPSTARCVSAVVVVDFQMTHIINDPAHRYYLNLELRSMTQGNGLYTVER